MILGRRQYLLLLLVLVASVGVSSCSDEPPVYQEPPPPLEPLALADIRGINYVRTTQDDIDICPDLHYEADPDCPWDMATIGSDLDRLQAEGVNTIRIFLNYYIFGAATLTNPNYSPDLAFAHLDDLIMAANKRGIYVMPILLAKYPQYTVDAAATETALRVHVRPIVTRYAAHPGIIAWDIFNEPDIGSPVDVRCWDWDNADFPDCFPLANARLHFLDAIAAEVRRLDPDTPLTISMAFAKSYFEPEGTDLVAADMVDFFAFHYYDNDPYDSGRYAQHWYYGAGFPADLRRAVAELRALDPTKPIVLTEIGFPSGPDTQRSAEEMRRDLIITMRLVDNELQSGVMLWPFLNAPERDMGGLFR